MRPRFPNVRVRIGNSDDNAFAILGDVSNALRRLGVSEEEISAYVKEATATDYQGIIDTTKRWVTVYPDISTSVSKPAAHSYELLDDTKRREERARVHPILRIRFDQDGFEFLFRGRCYTAPFIITAFIITVPIVGLAWAAFRGPPWLAVPALVLIVLPSATLITAMLWISAREYGRWLVARWHRPALGFSLAVILCGAEIWGLRWPDGSPINGYFFGSVVAAWCLLGSIFGLRKEGAVAANPPGE